MRLFLLCWIGSWLIVMPRLLPAQASQEEIAGYFTQALAAQQAGDYPRAIALYETVLKEGMTSAELHNNLGLAYDKAGKLGMAIVHFQRALRENRASADAENNLQAAQQKIKEPIPPAEEMFIVRGWLWLRALLTSGGWAFCFLILWWLTIGIWALNYRHAPTPISTSRKALPYIIAGCSFFALIFGFQQLYIETTDTYAIVVKSKAGLRAEPDLGSPEGMLLYEGTALTIVLQEGEWSQVELQNGTLGWILTDMVAAI